MSNYLQGGYEKKYIITKANGNPVDPKANYFVLRLDKDPHALIALQAYQTSVMKDNMELAGDLQDLLFDNATIQRMRKGE